jgi:hypothetical protein
MHNNERCVWQFNFREFDVDKDMYAPESIKLLVDSGIDFKANLTKGVDHVRFAELLMTSGVVLNHDVKWITFHAGYDFGCALWDRPPYAACASLVSFTWLTHSHKKTAQSSMHLKATPNPRQPVDCIFLMPVKISRARR